MDINKEEMEEEIEIDLRELLFHIRKFWYVVVICGLLGTLISAIYLWKIEVPIYQASAMIYMRDTGTKISFQDLQMNSELSSDYAVILKSKPVLNRVISDLDVKMSYNELYNSTSVTTLEDTRILKITIKNQDAKLAANLVNQLVERGVDTIEEVESKQPYTVEKADVDYNKVNTSDKKVLAIGMLIGVVLSLGVLFIQFILNDRLRGVDDVEKALGIPVLVGVPENKNLAKPKGDGKHEKRKISFK